MDRGPDRKRLGQPAPVLLTLVAGAALAACGGSDDAPAPPAQPPGTVAQPAPNEPIASKVEPLDAAVASGSCERYVPLVFSFAREGNRLGTPPAKSECRVAEQGVLRELRGTRFAGSAEFGTAALIEGQAEGSDATNTTVWVVDRDGELRIAHAVTGQAQIGSEASPQEDPAQVAESFVSATLDDDCKAIDRLLNPGGRIVHDAERPAVACKTVLNGVVFAPAIRKTPDARPVELGVTANLAFYGIATEDAYFTLLLSDADEPSGEVTVLDILPNTQVSLPDAQGAGRPDDG